MITDGEGSYGDAEFSLYLLIKGLEERFDSKVRFTVTRAHRRDEDGVEICDFKFTDKEKFDPECYDEIWFFGTTRLSTPLDEEELDILCRFMDCGKGVFATGDHTSLGAALCGNIPRVRSMRRWFSEDNPPPRDSELRHDSLRAGDDALYSSLDQNDDTPQIIFPKMYARPAGSALSVECCPRAYPHALLSGPKGRMIRCLPDHMHEGGCYEPVKDQMGAIFRHNGHEHFEYPYITKTERLNPEVIACARTPEPHLTFDPQFQSCNPLTQVSSFGSVGIYDGHRVNIGRVVVDSTFHHFFNVNLAGFEYSTDTTSRNKGRDAHEQIKNYHRNIGLWLASKKIQDSLCLRAIWESRWIYPVNEEILSISGLIDWSNVTPEYLLRLGAMTRGTMDSISNSSFSLAWALSLVGNLLGDADEAVKAKFLADPWRPRLTSIPPPDSGPPISPEALLNSVVGGVVLNIALRFPENVHGIAEKAEEELPELVREGSQKGAEKYSQIVKTCDKKLKGFLKDFSRSFKL